MKKLLIIGIFMFASLLIAGCNSGITGDVVADNDDSVKIPLSDLSDTVKFYEYNDDGVKINYFAVLGSDGKPRVAFDACDVCGGSKGYKQVGSDIKCNNCGRVFSIDGLGTKNKGYGCWPSYLPHEVKGNDIIISIDDIKKDRKKFI